MRQLLLVLVLCAGCSSEKPDLPPTPEEAMRRVELLSPELLGRAPGAGADVESVQQLDCDVDADSVRSLFEVQKANGIPEDDIVAQAVITVFARCPASLEEEAFDAIRRAVFFALDEPHPIDPIIAQAVTLLTLGS